jgi:putative endonuclease
MYHIYLLECNDGSIYTGITNDISRRLEQHQSGKGARYTRSRGAHKILYTEKCRSRSAALKREFKIKGMTRAQKILMIEKSSSD